MKQYIVLILLCISSTTIFCAQTKTLCIQQDSKSVVARNMQTDKYYAENINELVCTMNKALLEEFAYQCSAYKQSHTQKVESAGLKSFESQIIGITLCTMLQQIKKLPFITLDEQIYIFDNLQDFIYRYCSEYDRK